MAISQTAGAAANSGVAVGSLALPAFTTVTGQDIVFVIVLGSIAASIASITNAGGTYGAFTFRTAINATNVRIEIWTVHVTAGASTVFTANLAAGTTTFSFEAEQYSGVGSIGNTATASGSSILPDIFTAIQEGGNFIVAGFGFVCQAGDTLSAQLGTSRQSSIPAATAVGGALYDNTQVAKGTLQLMTKISTSREWVAGTVELRGTGLVSTPVLDYAPVTAPALQVARDVRYLNINQPSISAFNPSHFIVTPVGAVLKTGTVGVAYSETITGQGGTAPYSFLLTAGSLPTSLSLNGTTGVISGTPTAAGTFSFTIKATDVNGNFGSTNFQIIIVTPSSGGSYVFA